MNCSETLNELACALAKAQGAMRNAAKDADNPYFKSKYATLAECWNVARGPLSANGLSIIQIPKTTPGNGKGAVSLETILLHSSGQYISSEIEMPVVKPDAQGVGSAMTYARRYALSALIGIASEDDDGEGCVVHDQPAQINLRPQTTGRAKKMSVESEVLAPRGEGGARKSEPTPPAQAIREVMPTLNTASPDDNELKDARARVLSLLTDEVGLGLTREEIGNYIRRALERDDIGGGFKSLELRDLRTVESRAVADIADRIKKEM